MTPATCPNCHAEVRVDLSKVPAGRAARVACPTCATAFTINASASAPPPADNAGLAASAGRDEAWLRRELEALRSEMERNVAEKVVGRVLGALGKPIASVHGESDDEPKPALVCDADAQAAAYMVSVLTEMGYAAQAAGDMGAAWRALDVDQRVVVVTDTFTDDAQAATKILDRLSRLHGSKRRRLFVAYVGADVKTADGGLAFVLGANMTIHRGDLARFKDLLRRGLTERDKAYKPFLNAMEMNAEGSGS